ncbi:hypothetical protein HDA40_002418 [Hamadaea flava]|uniref:PQQ-like beta-propeller repeat protein n=1 Tax=Hamadaea flava TaxID=1742688 RepID=A0ABV8LMA5_9ACTN|nr:PQQ-like beta-propeller repeat protein [Hamadaea flava]MCP2323911.1 hypothetical protein [Hamadaea flava]
MIDLGVIEDHEPGPPPVPPWLRAWGVRRPLVALAAAGLCLALLGAAAPARPGPPVITIGGFSGQDGYQVIGDTLLSLHWGPSSGMTAYDLPTGERRWSQPLGDPLDGIEDLGEVVLVSTAPELRDPQTPTQAQLDANLAASVVTAYDVTTGEIRWTRSGSLYGSVDRKIALLRAPGPQKRIEAIEPSRGTTRWSRPVQPDGSWQLGWRVRNGYLSSHVDSLVELAKDGTVTLLDLVTGAVTQTAHVPPGGALTVAWNGVLGVRYGPAEPTGDPAVDRHITFYDVDADFAHLWTAAVPQGDLTPCSPDEVCSWGTDPQPRRFDLRTGEDRTVRGDQRNTLFGRLQDGQVGVWRVVNAEETHPLVYSGPAAHRPGWVGELDVTATTPRVRLLIGLSPIDQCLITVRWLLCLSNSTNPTGTSVVYAVRRADLDAEPRLRPTSGADLGL